MKFLFLVLAIAASQTILISNSLFRYKVDGNAAEEGWNTVSFNGNWPNATIANLPKPSGKVSYYCTTFAVNEIIAYATVKTVVSTRGGYRVFINGIETGRSFLPDGDLTSETEPTETSANVRNLTLGMSFDLAKIVSPDNLICIEVHTKTVNSESFSCSVSLHTNNDDLIVNGAIGYSHYGFYSTEWQEHYVNAYDKDPNTKWYVEDNDVYYGTKRAWLTWKWNDNRSQVVNYWKLFTGNLLDRRPRNIALYGTHQDCGSGLATSQSNINWTPIYETKPHFPNAYYGAFKEFTFSNNVAYRCYKMEFWQSYLQGIEIGEFYLGTRSTVSVDDTHLDVGGSNKNYSMRMNEYKRGVY